MSHNFDILAATECQYVELGCFIDKSCDSALARHEREVQVALRCALYLQVHSACLLQLRPAHTVAGSCWSRLKVMRAH